MNYYSTTEVRKSVLVQVAILEYHRLDGLNNKHLFLTVLEAISLRSGYQHGWGLGEDPLPDYVLTWSSLVHAFRKRNPVSLPLL